MHETGAGWPPGMRAKHRRRDSLRQELGQLSLFVTQLVVMGISQEVSALCGPHEGGSAGGGYLNGRVGKPCTLDLPVGK